MAEIKILYTPLQQKYNAIPEQIKEARRILDNFERLTTSQNGNEVVLPRKQLRSISSLLTRFNSQK